MFFAEYILFFLDIAKDIPIVVHSAFADVALCLFRKGPILPEDFLRKIKLFWEALV